MARLQQALYPLRAPHLHHELLLEALHAPLDASLAPLLIVEIEDGARPLLHHSLVGLWAIGDIAIRPDVDAVGIRPVVVASCDQPGVKACSEDLDTADGPASQSTLLWVQIIERQHGGIHQQRRSRIRIEAFSRLGMEGTQLLTQTPLLLDKVAPVDL